jgi:hypothetical protein
MIAAAFAQSLLENFQNGAFRTSRRPPTHLSFGFKSLNLYKGKGRIGNAGLSGEIRGGRPPNDDDDDDDVLRAAEPFINFIKFGRSAAAQQHSKQNPRTKHEKLHYWGVINHATYINYHC